MCSIYKARKMNRKMNSMRQVCSPGSVDSWDMENLKFLRKMSNGGMSARDSTDSISYNSDNDSAVFENRTVIGEVSESDDEKVYRNHRHQTNIYGCRIDEESEAEYGMPSDNTGGDINSSTRLLDEALYSGGNGFALLNKSIVMKQMKSMAKSTLKDPYLEELAEPEPIIEPTPVVRKSSKTTSMGGNGLARKHSRSEDNFDRRFMKSRKPKPSLVTLGFMEPQLEDCYMLDVVTIRNESVLAERGRVETSHCAFSDSQDSETECIDKMYKLNGNGRRNGSAGLPSSSSSSVSSEEFNSAREGSYFPSPGDDPIEIHRESSPDGTRASSCSPVSVVVRGECATRYPINCGGGYTQSSDRCSFATASSTYYYLGQQSEEFEAFQQDNVEQHMSGKEQMRMLETPRSTSPYYVRLRRDLIPPSYTPPHPRQPWNFGMNRQGLLVIDYSPNWDGLESYVRSLSLK